MYPTKEGGGGKQEFYDPTNGKYTDKEKAKFLDDEIANIVMRYIFGLSNTYDPRFPIFGFHNEEYCELYVKHRICKVQRDVPYLKMDYLLNFRKKDDKSLFFKLFGYQNNNRDKNLLFKEIMDGSDFSKMKFQKFTEYGIFVMVPTRIKVLNKEKRVEVTTIWRYSKDEWFHFVTLIPKCMEEK